MVRIIAFLTLLMPGLLAVYGIKLMRDSFFGIVQAIYLNVGLQFFAGLVFLLGGIGFIGGFLYHRDKKRNKTKSARTKNLNDQT